MKNILNKEKVLEMVANNKLRYQNNTPFPNIHFNDFFNPEYLREVLKEFPELKKSKEGIKFSDVNQKKHESKGESLMGEKTKELVHFLNSEPFLNILSGLTGIEDLLPDPTLSGGGYHEILSGGFLKVHADFNIHPKYKLDRRINLLIYLNEDWKKEYGGEFELWDSSMTKCITKIEPLFNTIAIFSTTSTSYHGHPNPLNCPPNRSRKSIALYYYTNGRPEGEKLKYFESHSTIFKARKEDNKNFTESYLMHKIKTEKKKYFLIKSITFIKLLSPPIFFIVIKKIRTLFKI